MVNLDGLCSAELEHPLGYRPPSLLRGHAISMSTRKSVGRSSCGDRTAQARAGSRVRPRRAGGGVGGGPGTDELDGRVRPRSYGSRAVVLEVVIPRCQHTFVAAAARAAAGPPASLPCSHQPSPGCADRAGRGASRHAGQPPAPAAPLPPAGPDPCLLSATPAPPPAATHHVAEAVLPPHQSTPVQSTHIYPRAHRSARVRTQVAPTCTIV